MKYIILIFSVFITSSSFGQTAKVTSLKLYPIDCQTNQIDDFWYSDDSVKIFKLPENHLIVSFLPKIKRTFPYQMDYLPISNYQLSFTNNFGERVNHKIAIKDQSVNEVKFCPDTLVRLLTQNTLSKLQDGDSIVIDYKSYGCFDQDYFILTILKTKTDYTASLYTKYFTKEPKWENQRFLASTKLNQEQILAFKRFENELSSQMKGGCSTIDEYEIKSKYLNITKTDKSCEWNGFYKLKRAFFGDDR